MVSEGILGNPAIFAGIEPDPLVISREYLSLTKQYPHGLKAVRPHLYKFLHRELSYHTELREFLGETSTEQLHSIPDKLRNEQLRLYSELSFSSSSASSSSSSTSSSLSELSLLSLNLDEEKLPMHMILYKDIPTWYKRHTTYKHSTVNTTTEVQTEIETEGICLLFGEDDNNEEES